MVCCKSSFKYHLLCKSLNFTHMMFVDDLILFRKGNIEFILILLRGFATFSASSGLVMNNTKSEIFFNAVK